MVIISLLTSNLYRKFSRQYTQWKYYNSVCIRTYQSFQRHTIYSLQGSEKFYRRIYTSAHYNDKSETKDDKNIIDKLNSGVTRKDNQNSSNEKSLGDILIKTETDANKVVTKVTIEKAKTQETEEVAKQPVLAQTTPSM